MMNLTAVSGFHDQADPGAALLANQVMLHRTGEQQRRDRRHFQRGMTVAEDDDLGPFSNRPRDFVADLIEPLSQGEPATGHFVKTIDHVGPVAGKVAVVVDMHELY